MKSIGFYEKKSLTAELTEIPKRTLIFVILENQKNAPTRWLRWFY